MAKRTLVDQHTRLTWARTEGGWQAATDTAQLAVEKVRGENLLLGYEGRVRVGDDSFDTEFFHSFLTAMQEAESLLFEHTGAPLKEKAAPAPPAAPPKSKNADRDAAIMARYRAGASLDELSEEFGLSVHRLRQIERAGRRKEVR